jgi:integrase
MRAVVTMLHDGIDMGWVPADALRGFKNLKEEKKEIQILESRDEVVLQKALSAKRHFGLLMTFLLNTGLRMQEALGLQWEAVTDSAVFLSAADTKGQADRTVPLTREASQTLNLLRVFGPKDGPFTDVKYQTFYKAWSAATERAGIAGLTPHGLRHTCCTRLIRKGVPLPVVQKWMGKADLEAARDLLQG